MAESAQRREIACDLAGLHAAHLGVVGTLARLQLVARRAGYELRLRRISPRLGEVIAFVGLADVLGVEPERETEEREEAGGVEEEGELGDPARR
jgi:hypothetical protein